MTGVRSVRYDFDSYANEQVRLDDFIFEINTSYRGRNGDDISIINYQEISLGNTLQPSVSQLFFF